MMGPGTSLAFVRMECHRVRSRSRFFPIAPSSLIEHILGVGKESRMNRPATMQGNLEWRFGPEQLTRAVSEKLL
jgi:hypothetical protein